MATNTRPARAAAPPPTIKKKSCQSEALYTAIAAASVVQEGAPLLARQVQVEMLEWTDAAHGEVESLGQPAGGVGVDQELGAVVELGAHQADRHVLGLLAAHIDEADLAASAAPVD